MSTNSISKLISKTVIRVAAVSTVASICLLAIPASAQGYPPPTDEYVATTEPVYFEGHAAYWNGERWYWRDEHGSWQHYDREPPELHERRIHAPPARHDYGRDHRDDGHGRR